MRSYLLSAVAVVSLLPVYLTNGGAAENNGPVIYESPFEFFGSGDLDGDGRTDVVIVDKETGKYRIGYQMQSGALTWVDCRPSGIKGLTGFTLGRLLTNTLD